MGRFYAKLVMKKPYSASYKKAIVVAALILAIIVAGFAVFLSACKYQVMSSTEKLKNQLYEEYGEYTITLIESIRVLRQWNSFSAEKWTYIVDLTKGRGQHLYVLREGVFYEIVN